MLLGWGFFFPRTLLCYPFSPPLRLMNKPPRLIANQKRRYASIFTHTTQRPCQRTLNHPNHFLHPTWFLRFFFSPLAPGLRSPNPAMKAGAGLSWFRDSPGRAQRLHESPPRAPVISTNPRTAARATDQPASACPGFPGSFPCSSTHGRSPPLPDA
jgi:hypothetical protein